MKRNILIVLGVLIVLLGGGLFFWQRGSGSFLSPVVETEEIEGVESVFWEDPAGFSFDYPGDLELDPHEEDEDNYAHLEFTHLENEGRLVILLKETEYEDVEEWAEEEAEEAQIFDTDLGGELAKKAAFLEPKRLLVAAIDVDALLLIEVVSGSGDYWPEVLTSVMDSFAFIPLEGEEVESTTTSGGNQGGGGIIEEAEEVIQ